MKLEELSALELGKLVNGREISAVGVIDYFKNRVEERNPSINAFTYTKWDDAYSEAEKIDSELKIGHKVGPFAGVPVALKDFLPSKKGWPASHGGVKSYQTIDQEDGAIYQGFKNLGCIAVGKTNAPAFGFRATTDNKMYGPTSTPFKAGYNSGGSSGGSCAAVADGLVLMAETGDAGGSTRCPSAWCGTFGLKPSAGMIPSVCRPDAWTATHPYCCSFAATKTVGDALTLLGELERFDLRDPLSVPISLRRDPSSVPDSMDEVSDYNLRIGYTFDFGLFPYPEEEIVIRMTDALRVIERKIGSLIPVDFHFNYSKSDMEEAWLRGINIDDALNPKVQKLIEEHPEDLPDEFIRWNKIARNSTMQDYLNFHKIRTDILDAHVDAFKNCDILLAPVTGCLPVKNSNDGNTKGPSRIRDVEIDPLIGFSYTYLENMTGWPAASVPIGVSSDGLPIGIQVIAPRYQDHALMYFCLMLELLFPWDYKVPFNREIPKA